MSRPRSAMPTIGPVYQRPKGDDSGGRTERLVAPQPPQQQGPPNYPVVGAGGPLNPPFDPRLTSTGGANPAMKDRPLKRGRIIRADIDTGSDEPHGMQVNFMFNPTELGVSFSYDQSMPDTAKEQFGDNVPKVTGNFIGEGAITVDLLFDRTYEVWDRHKRGGTHSIAAQFGVHADVLAFWAFLGMIKPNYGVNTSWEQLYPEHAFNAKYAYLYIGDRLKYFGYVTSLSVQYTHWSYDMIPTRAGMSIGFNVILTRPGGTDTTYENRDDLKAGGDVEAGIPYQWGVPGRDYYVGPVT